MSKRRAAGVDGPGYVWVFLRMDHAEALLEHTQVWKPTGKAKLAVRVLRRDIKDARKRWEKWSA